MGVNEGVGDVGWVLAFVPTPRMADDDVDVDLVDWVAVGCHGNNAVGSKLSGTEGDGIEHGGFFAGGAGPAEAGDDFGELRKDYQGDARNRYGRPRWFCFSVVCTARSGA